MWNSSLPPFMEKTILNFHFDYLQISFIKIWWCVNPKVDVNEWPIFLHRLTDNFFALKYMSEQRRLHIEKTFQGCSSPQALSDPLHIQFLLSALTRRAIRALSCLRTKFAYPLRTHRPAKEASLEAICDCDVDGWSSEVTLWTHLYNSPLHWQSGIIGDGHSHVYVCVVIVFVSPGWCSILTLCQL